MIQPARVRTLVDRRSAAGRYVLYWMQQSQRARANHALEYAIEQANELDLPVVVGFGLMDDYPEANARHYQFMLEGLRDVATDLGARGLKLVCRRGAPPAVALELAQRAALVVCDRGYTRHQRQWRADVAARAPVRVVQIESDVVVPVEVASAKQEFAARTLRPKIHARWDEYLVPVVTTEPRHTSLRLRIRSDIDVADPKRALAKLRVDRSVGPSPTLEGGSSAARRRLAVFLARKLDGYAEGRSEPAAAQTSVMSAHLHFGQISPVELALAVQRAKAPAKDRAAYLEELIVRRELAVNYVHYCPSYDSYDGLPDWAKQTLAAHATDRREHLYTRDQLERAATHDACWNAAQREMTLTGYMHNHMRMYWGKKILEWTDTPRCAYETTLHLNNKYFLCGRDPVSYANVAWIYGLHDRPWGPERKVFGLIRYMNEAGLRRKFDMDAYVRRVDALAPSRSG